MDLRSPELRARAEAILSGAVTPPEARPAATVVLLRDGAQGLETYLLHRKGSMAFAAGRHVFPGGAVDPGDEDIAGDAPTGAAARELWEEAGVWLGEGPAPSERVWPSGVRVAITPVPWSRWITPALETRRFDTHFFVCAMPHDQTTADDDAGGEAQTAAWVPLAGVAGLSLMPPTLATMHQLSSYVTVADVLAGALDRVPVTYAPTFELTADGGVRLLL